MAKPADNVFDYCDKVRERFKRFSLGREEWAEDISQYVETLKKGDIWSPAALLQISPGYESAGTITELVNKGELQADWQAVASMHDNLYRHQVEAIDAAKRDDNYVITAGTGSGKSLGYIIPIVDHIFASRRHGEKPSGIKAVICYPMNALVNSQLQELRKYELEKHGITYARYTGQESPKDREKIHKKPPDILLTNFMMLEYLLTRNSDGEKGILGALSACKFMVMDELHTYRGRQGADIAMLIRRLRLFLNKPKHDEFLCIGTSATMTSGEDDDAKGDDDSNQLVADYATSLFGREVKPQNIIRETLVRQTNQEKNLESVKPHLRDEMQQGVDALLKSRQTFQNSAVAVWCEFEFGINFSKRPLVRQHPKPVAEAAGDLAQVTGKEQDECEVFLREFLTAAADKDKQFFAVRLHQFFSGPGEFLCTIKDDSGKRKFSVGGDKSDGRRNPFFSTHFCRNSYRAADSNRPRDCYHEFHPVEVQGEHFVPRDIDDTGEEKSDEISFGFITPAVGDMEWHGGEDDERESKLPDAWLEQDTRGNIRVRRNYQKFLPQRVILNAQGRRQKDDQPTGAEYIFLPGKFRFCPKCGDVHDGRGRDGNRLAALNAEGRCSATTALLISLLEFEPPYKEGGKAKTLAFSDNRQDAALQAGYFNDFMFTLKLRAGLLKALEDAEGNALRHNVIAGKVKAALGFAMDDVRANFRRRREFLDDPDIANESNLQRMVNVLEDVIGYHLMHDLRRGWRNNNPNLTMLKLLDVRFEGIEQMKELSNWKSPTAHIREMSGEGRLELARTVMAHLLEERCVNSRFLNQDEINRVKNTARGNLSAQWYDPHDDDHFKPSQKLRLGKAGRGGQRQQIASGPTSRIAKKLRSNRIWKRSRPGKLPTQDYAAVVECVLENLRSKNMLKKSDLTKESSLWELNADCLIWQLTAERAKEDDYHVQLYRSVQDILSAEDARADFAAMEAREHTAQVNAADREECEKRFRNKPGENDKERLPVLVCSPTMELGIDISDLNTVYLRNVPPTPANYVQRSGRAGRAKAPALIVSYCAARSPHDQYYFQRKRDMVAGRIRAPKIELANQDLLTSHFNAIWLQKTGVSLPNPVAGIMDYETKGGSQPIRDCYQPELQNPGIKQEVEADIAALIDELYEYDLVPAHARHWLVREYAPLPNTYMYEGLEGALDRWRLLFRAVCRQIENMQKISHDLSLASRERERANRIYQAALRQRETLIKEEEQDFYSYRFLASQGFLPGYNFPRLPLMAFLPRRRTGRFPDRVVRPRFLALSEFGPSSLIYHQGSRYRVSRAILQQTRGAEGTELAKEEMRICSHCGYGYQPDGIPDCCRCCKKPLTTASRLDSLYESGNFVARPVDRINAGEEERQRQGYDLVTSYAFGESPHDRISGTVQAGGSAFALDYGQAATVWRINLGWKSQQARNGFLIDPITGDWRGKEGEGEGEDEPAEHTERVIPYVQDRRNILVMRWEQPLSPSTFTTLRHALKLGMTEVFQVEENELSVEPLPGTDVREDSKRYKKCNAFLYYESAEGGAGVLTRLPAEPTLLAEVARAALRMMHYELPKDASGVSVSNLKDYQAEGACKSGCYRCLLSYYNQPDHQYIDREDAGALAILLGLVKSEVTMSQHPRLATEKMKEKQQLTPPPPSKFWMGIRRHCGGLARARCR